MRRSGGVAAVRLRVLVAGLALVSACAKPPPAAPRLAEPIPVDDARAAALLDSMRSAASERERLRGMAELSFDGAAGSVRSKQAIVLEQPSHLRIEVLGFLSQAVAVLVTDGDRFELLRAEDRSRREGAVYPGLLFEVAQIDLTPEEGVSLLLGAPPEIPGLRVGSAALLDDGSIQVELEDGQRVVRQRLEFDGSGRLRLAESWAPGDRLVWRAQYDEYGSEAGVDFAHEIALWFPESQTRVELEFEQVELNPALPAGVFTLQRPGATAPGAGKRGDA